MHFVERRIIIIIVLCITCFDMGNSLFHLLSFPNVTSGESTTYDGRKRHDLKLSTKALATGGCKLHHHICSNSYRRSTSAAIETFTAYVVSVRCLCAWYLLPTVVWPSSSQRSSLAYLPPIREFSRAKANPSFTCTSVPYSVP